MASRLVAGGVPGTRRKALVLQLPLLVHRAHNHHCRYSDYFLVGAVVSKGVTYLEKECQPKEDGRYIIFYTFGEELDEREEKE